MPWITWNCFSMSGKINYFPVISDKMSYFWTNVFIRRTFIEWSASKSSGKKSWKQKVFQQTEEKAQKEAWSDHAGASWGRICQYGLFDLWQLLQNHEPYFHRQGHQSHLKGAENEGGQLCQWVFAQRWRWFHGSQRSALPLFGKWQRLLHLWVPTKGMQGISAYRPKKIHSDHKSDRQKHRNLSGCIQHCGKAEETAASMILRGKRLTKKLLHEAIWLN